MKNSELVLSAVVAATSLLFTTDGVLAQPDIPEVDDTSIQISELVDRQTRRGSDQELCKIGG